VADHLVQIRCRGLVVRGGVFPDRGEHPNPVALVEGQPQLAQRRRPRRPIVGSTLSPHACGGVGRRHEGLHLVVRRAKLLDSSQFVRMAAIGGPAREALDVE